MHLGALGECDAACLHLSIEPLPAVLGGRGVVVVGVRMVVVHIERHVGFGARDRGVVQAPGAASVVRVCAR